MNRYHHVNKEKNTIKAATKGAVLAFFAFEATKANASDAIKAIPPIEATTTPRPQTRAAPMLAPIMQLSCADTCLPSHCDIFSKGVKTAPMISRPIIITTKEVAIISLLFLVNLIFILWIGILLDA